MKAKKLLSACIAAAIIAASALPAYATDYELNKAINDLHQYVQNCEMDYIYYGYITHDTSPKWSASSTERMLEVIEESNSKTYETIEEVNEQRAKVDSVVESMTVSSREVEFMINIYESENNLDNYYDAEAWGEFTALLEEGKSTLENGDEEEIHQIYIKMRNGFNKLCLYNTTVGDINNDGEVDVKDVTFLQICLAKKSELTSSQKLVILDFDKNDEKLNSSVTTVTNLQMYLAGYEEAKPSGYNMNQLIEHNTFDEDLTIFNRAIDFSNYVYYYGFRLPKHP